MVVFPVFGERRLRYAWVVGFFIFVLFAD